VSRGRKQLDPNAEENSWLAMISTAIGGTALYRAEIVRATSASGFKATIAGGTFDEIDVFNQTSKDPLPPGFPGNLWLSLQKTKGQSDLYVQSNVWQPGSTGWQSHPGHSLIIVTSGSLTEYYGDCTPVPEQSASTLVDHGHGHIHIIKIEDGHCIRRIDIPAPTSCAHIQ